MSRPRPRVQLRGALSRVWSQQIIRHEVAEHRVEIRFEAGAQRLVLEQLPFSGRSRTLSTCAAAFASASWARLRWRPAGCRPPRSGGRTRANHRPQSARRRSRRRQDRRPRSGQARRECSGYYWFRSCRRNTSVIGGVLDDNGDDSIERKKPRTGNTQSSGWRQSNIPFLPASGQELSQARYLENKDSFYASLNLRACGSRPPGRPCRPLGAQAPAICAAFPSSRADHHQGRDAESRPQMTWRTESPSGARSCRSRSSPRRACASTSARTAHGCQAM